MVQVGIKIPSEDPVIAEGEHTYIIVESKIPDMTRLGMGWTKASLKLLRTWQDDTLDEMVKLEWFVGKDKEIQPISGILKRLLSINANIMDLGEGDVYVTPSQMMAQDVFPDNEDLDGLVVVADLLYGKKPYVDRNGISHKQVTCFHVRAPTTDEGYAFLQKDQFLMTAPASGKIPAEYEVFSPPVREPEEDEEI